MSKKNGKNNSVDLDIGTLSGHLWEAANILRGPVDAADFKTYIFRYGRRRGTMRAAHWPPFTLHLDLSTCRLYNELAVYKLETDRSVKPWRV